MTTKDNQEAERVAFEKHMTDIGMATYLHYEKEKQQYSNIPTQRLWKCFQYARATLTTPQVNEEVASGDAVAEVVEEKLADFMKPHGTVKWHQTDFPIGTKFYTTPSPSNVWGEALRLADKIYQFNKLGKCEERNILLKALATYSSTDSVSISKAEYEVMKADAERYRWLRHGDNDYLVLQGNIDHTWLLRNERLDEAIDKVIKNETM